MVDGGRGFCANLFPYKGFRLFSFLRVIFSDVFASFFVEGSILAQDERWRRA